MKYKLLTLLLTVVFLTGCWDEMNIEERGFVIGSAIDLAEEQTSENVHVTLTNQLVVPAGLGTPAQGSGEEKAFNNLSATGESIDNIVHSMGVITSRVPFFGHLQLVIISSEIAKQPNLFSSIMDFFIRDPEMRRKVKVIISDDKAKKLLDVLPANEKLPVMYINSVIENAENSIESFRPLIVGELHQLVLEQDSYIIPRVTVKDKQDLSYMGGVAFSGKSNKMVGTLDGMEMIGLNLVKGESKGGTIKFRVEDQLMIYEISNLNSKIKIDVKDKENPHITIKIDSDGSIGEMYGSKSLLKKEYEMKIKEEIESEMEDLASKTVEVAQQDLGLDVFGFAPIIRQRHYDTWEQIRNDWDQGENYFANATIDVSATINIQSTGATDRTKETGIEGE